jgi:DUF1009 family protein
MTMVFKEKEIVGIVAGGGRFPIMAADAARRQGHRVVAVAFHEETDPKLSDRVDRIVWIHLGQLGHLIRGLKRHGVQKALMAGTITKRLMFKLKPDLKGMAFMSKMAIFHDDGILGSLAWELKKEGIEIISATSFLPDLLSPSGCLTKRRPSKKEEEDIRFGWQMAKELGRMDIGQCVVVRGKTVLALEAMEGTDEAILRGGRLAGEKAVVIKVSKPSQDLRFDMPTVGLKTVQNMSKVKASVLALETGKTLIFDKSEMIRHADQTGISVVCQTG